MRETALTRAHDCTLDELHDDDEGALAADGATMPGHGNGDGARGRR